MVATDIVHILAHDELAISTTAQNDSRQKWIYMQWKNIYHLVDLKSLLMRLSLAVFKPPQSHRALTMLNTVGRF